MPCQSRGQRNVWHMNYKYKVSGVPSEAWRDFFYIRKEKIEMLEITPVTLKEANGFVQKYHRHHRPSAGHKFSVAVANESGTIVGVAICGRPVSRYLDDGRTLEIARLCTDGTENACSKLYGAACRAAKAMGYTRVVTYILQSEPGTSLKASGFVCEGTAGGLEWTGKRKPKKQTYPKEMKTRWVRKIGGNADGER